MNVGDEPSNEQPREALKNRAISAQSLIHNWRGQSDAGRYRDAARVIQRPEFLTVALWEFNGVSREAGRIVDAETNDDHARDPGTLR
jgi:hypothetical protein